MGIKKNQTFLSADQTSIPCVKQVFPVLEWNTFNSFLLALWRSRNEGDLFGSSKIEADKSCNQLLKIILQYRGHLHEESVWGIFRYSKEWKSFTIDIVPKSAQNTHLTAEPIIRQCTVYGSRRPIASKPGSSPLEQYSLNNTRDNHDLMQPAPVPPLIVLTSTLSRSFRRKGQDKVQKMIVWGQIVLDYGWLVILSRLGRSGGDDPGLEAIRGREP